MICTPLSLPLTLLPSLFPLYKIQWLEVGPSAGRPAIRVVRPVSSLNQQRDESGTKVKPERKKERKGRRGRPQEGWQWLPEGHRGRRRAGIPPTVFIASKQGRLQANSFCLIHSKVGNKKLPNRNRSDHSCFETTETMGGLWPSNGHHRPSPPISLSLSLRLSVWFSMP